MKQNLINWRVAGMVFAAAAIGAAVPGCEDTPGVPGAEELLKQCGLTCDARGIADGNASISGNVKVDAFFGSVVNFSGKADLIAGNIKAELDKIRASLELEANASPADIKAAIIAKFNLDAEAGLSIKYQPPRCDVSAQATVEASARCEGTVTPPNATVECKGECEAKAGAELECTGGATAKCVGTAPNLQCEGECSGTCELSAAAECTGTCKGECTGTCSAEDGEGNCNGTCDGECQGTCELSAKGECAGECKGECEYTPPSGGCEANATLKCTAMANASVTCNGTCKGEVTPPSASAECQASAKADASVNVDCRPPELTLEYAFAANASADAQANFEAFLTRFKGSFAVIVSEIGRADVVLKAGATLTASASGAVTGAVNASLSGDVSLKEKIGLTCALTELGDVASVITGATGRLNGQLTAAASLTAAFTS